MPDAEKDAGLRWWCDNYLPPLTCLTAPSSRSGRCDQCQATLDAIRYRCSDPGCPGDGRYAAPGRGHLESCTHPGRVTSPGSSEADR